MPQQIYASFKALKKFRKRQEIEKNAKLQLASDRAKGLGGGEHQSEEDAAKQVIS